MDAHTVLKASPIELVGSATTAATCQTILTSCLDHINHNIALVHEAVNSEAVHQLRVGLRRARSGVMLFKPHIKRDTRTTFNNKLRELGNMFGLARDWDVFLTDTLPKAASQLNELNEAAIRDLVTPVWQEEYRKACRHSWPKISVNEISFSGDELDLPVEETASHMLDLQANRMRRRLRHLNTPEQRHDARKALKRLRYSTEFLQSLYDAKLVKAYLAHCKLLQDVLGKINDASTVMRLSVAIDLPNDSDMLTEWAERRVQKAVKDLDPTLRDFRKARPFWY